MSTEVFNMFSLTLDTSEFDKTMDQYMKFQKRLPADVVNAKLYYIARNATMTTKAADKSKIENDMRAKATNYNAPLAAIIVNSQLGKMGEKGLTGEKMARAVEKLIKKRKNAVNFVRAGWKNAIVILEKYLRSNGELNTVRRWQTPVDKSTLRKKNFEKLGKSIPARIEQSPRAWGEIQNDVSDPKGNDKLNRIKIAGLQKAIDKEVQSMYIYLERKLNPVHRSFNEKMGWQ